MALATLLLSNEESKVCNACKDTLPCTPEFFGRNKRRPGGFQDKCKPCTALYRRGYWSQMNPWERERLREHYHRNATADRERKRREKLALPVKQPEPLPATRFCNKCAVEFPLTSEFFQSNGSARYPKLTLAYTCKKCSSLCRMERRRRNLEKHRERDRRLYHANPKALVNVKKYQATAKGLAARKRANRNRYEKSWLQMRVASSIRNVIGGRKGASHWPKMLGYTPDDLRRHLERQFTKGMSWDKFKNGGIHIDHIIPVSSFDITGPNCPNLLACFALSNLRPLAAKENIKKGAKRLFLL
jgi:hypothetical protein